MYIIQISIQITVESNFTSLEILEVYLEDAGNYAVIAKNLGGESRTSCLLTIEGVYINGEVTTRKSSKPMFTQQLQNREVQEGSRAHLKCAASGFPEPEVSIDRIRAFNSDQSCLYNITPCKVDIRWFGTNVNLFLT